MKLGLAAIKYHKVNSFLSVNENHYIEEFRNSNTPLSDAFTVLTPSQSAIVQ